MSSAGVIMILAFFLTMKATIGRSVNSCGCRHADDSQVICVTRGCSVGTNPHCNNADFGRDPFTYFNFELGIWDPILLDTYYYNGCNCPGSPSNISTNGYYADIGHRLNDYRYNYTNCTGFGGKKYDHDAIDCCNFCCDRNDPYATNRSSD